MKAFCEWFEYNAETIIIGGGVAFLLGLALLTLASISMQLQNGIR